MKLSMMQPYFLPYLGYFQLINIVDKFCFGDNVNFIKKGWINRNRILINNEAKYFTLPLKGASSLKKINEVKFIKSYAHEKIKKKIQLAYKKAPFYNQVYPLIEECLKLDTSKISDLAIYSVRRVCQYLEIHTALEINSEVYAETESMDKMERIITICRQNNADTFINPIGGQGLYSKKSFKEANIDLFFLKSGNWEYKQFNKKFVPNLSIIDVIMFNLPERINEMLNDYELV